MSAVPQPRIELLPMHAADLDEVLRIEYRVCLFPWGLGNFSDSMASGYSCWVCRVDGELAGYFVVMLAVDDAHLLTISLSLLELHLAQGLMWDARNRGKISRPVTAHRPCQ